MFRKHLNEVLSRRGVESVEPTEYRAVCRNADAFLQNDEGSAHYLQETVSGAANAWNAAEVRAWIGSR